MSARFCIKCGSTLRRRAVRGQRRSVCTSCGHVHFDDPKVAVGVVAERSGRILLVQRDLNPHRGEWSFPSGYVDAGESLEDAAVREAREETDVDIRIQRLLGAYSAPGERVIFIAYAARVIRGRINVGDECQDVRYFPIDRLPRLAFTHDAQIMNAWRATR